MNFRFAITFLCLSILLLPLSAQRVQAQAADPCTTNVIGKSDAQLQQDLDACNAEITRLQGVLDNTKKNTANYANEVARLTALINTAQANIKAKTVAIANLSTHISEKEKSISDLETRIENDTQSVAGLVRKTNEIDNFSVAEAVLSGKDLSSFFVDMDTYSSTRFALLALVNNLRDNKTEAEVQKQELSKQKDSESAAKAQIEASKRQVEASQATQKSLLTQSQNEEKAYAALVADKKAKADAIRTALFGLRDTEAIPFGTALQYAQEASRVTGVRAALILGILQQESNLGANVGTCVIIDLNSGETRNVNSGKIYVKGIHPTRDLPLLQSLLPALGRDPLNTKVSCPLSIGYGGAMGPAQFIPSTWNLIQPKISSALSKDTPDPWNPRDAIMAMAVFLKDLIGTTGDQYTDERTAACRYYSGQTCYVNGSASRGLTYGIQVMNRVNTLQSNIDLLSEV